MVKNGTDRDVSKADAKEVKKNGGDPMKQTPAGRNGGRIKLVAISLLIGGGYQARPAYLLKPASTAFSEAALAASKEAAAAALVAELTSAQMDLWG